MTIEIVSACVLLLPDRKTRDYLYAWSRQFKRRFPKTFEPKRVGRTLPPFHMTMIAGIKLPIESYEVILRESVQRLGPFREMPLVPVLADMENITLNGNTLGLRLKFTSGTYVLTGNRVHNQELLVLLGATSFNLNMSHHITFGVVSGGYENLDKLSFHFGRSLERRKEKLMTMTLKPEVWVKSSERWRRLEIAN